MQLQSSLPKTSIKGRDDHTRCKVCMNMFYATDMLPSRKKVYKDYKIYKPKCINMMFYTGEKKRKRNTHRQRDKEIKEIHCPSRPRCLRRYFPISFVK